MRWAVTIDPSVGTVDPVALAREADDMETGADRCVFMLPHGPAGEMRAIVPGCAAVVREAASKERAS